MHPRNTALAIFHPSSIQPYPADYQTTGGVWIKYRAGIIRTRPAESCYTHTVLLISRIRMDGGGVDLGMIPDENLNRS